MHSKSGKNPALVRFRGTSGVLQFARLVEQASPKRRKVLLSIIEKDDPEFYTSVMKKVVAFDQLDHMDESTLEQIIMKTSPKTLAFALNDMPENFRSQLLGYFDRKERRMFKDEEDQLPRLLNGLSLGARKKILKIARKLEAEDKIVFEVDEIAPMNSE